MSKKLKILSSVAFLLIGGIFFLKYSPLGSELVFEASAGGSWLLPLVVVGALLDSVNPCAFSVLLITIAFLFSMNKPRSEVLALGASYIAGLFIVYLLIGLGLLKALHIFGVPHFMGRLGAAAVILFGALNILSYLFPQVRWLPGIPASVHQKMAVLMRRVSLPAVFLVGALVAICEFPCTGGPYIMILGLLHDSASYAVGFGYLLFYNLLFVAPLVLILLVASHKELLDKVSEWRSREAHRAKWWVGLAMVALGLIIIFFI
jgi:cytochrome c-type biogenesis protein